MFFCALLTIASISLINKRIMCIQIVNCMGHRFKKVKQKSPIVFAIGLLLGHKYVLMRTNLPVASVFDLLSILRAYHLFSQAYTTGYSMLPSNDLDWSIVYVLIAFVAFLFFCSDAHCIQHAQNLFLFFLVQFAQVYKTEKQKTPQMLAGSVLYWISLCSSFNSNMCPAIGIIPYRTKPFCIFNMYICLTHVFVIFLFWPCKNRGENVYQTKLFFKSFYFDYN